jgi:hypothetical protein
VGRRTARRFFRLLKHSAGTVDVDSGSLGSKLGPSPEKYAFRIDTQTGTAWRYLDIYDPADKTFLNRLGADTREDDQEVALMAVVGPRNIGLLSNSAP